MRRRVSFPPLPSEGVVVATRFRVERVQHLGGGYVVPVARDGDSGQEVMLKVGPAVDADHGAIHANEVRCLTRVRHPNVARLVGHGVCEDTGLRWMALEHVPGLTLRRWLDLHAPVRPADLRVMGLGLAAAVAEIHRRGIVLGGALDEPDVVVGWEHGLRRPVITGFGRALLEDDRAVVTSTSPPHPADDVRAVGELLHRMLFGTASDGSPLALASDRSPAVREVVARCLAPDPSRRPASGAVLARELAQALDA